MCKLATSLIYERESGSLQSAALIGFPATGLVLCPPKGVQSDWDCLNLLWDLLQLPEMDQAWTGEPRQEYLLLNELEMEVGSERKSFP